jgi:hypothetical protein
MKYLVAPSVLAALTLVTTMTGQVLRVPSQYTTITAALAGAKSGTTILVAAGTYNEQLTWPAVNGIRLMSEEGAAKTTIDGQKKGTVITFTGALSRSTVLQGFTVANGFLQNSNNRNYGAGLSINQASPTIRENRITGNVLDGPNWNYGGGIYVTGSGANPLITGNVIDANEARNGSWNYGAGIYVGSGAMAEIVGNQVLNNKNHSPANNSGNRGHGAGIYADGAVIIASNLVAGNLNQVTSWNYGAGIRVGSTSGTSLVLNNTVVNNTCSGGSWAYGGGFYAEASASVTAIGNIIALNTVTNSSRPSGGGMYRSSATGSGTVVLDYNDVWSNANGDYVNLTKGANSISVDPKFVSASDYHLAQGSPCVDAIPAGHLPASVTTDVDGDPRRIDGDLDGGTQGGAILDIGGDELTDVALTLTGTPKLGNNITLKVTSVNTGLFMMAVDLSTGSLFLEPWGYFLLSPAFVPLPGSVTPGAIGFGVPNDNRLVGLTSYWQAIVFPLPLGPRGQFTNRLALTVY